MAAPWEQYQSAAPDESGPWAQYAAPSQPASKPVKIGQDAFADTLRGELQNADWLTRNIAGAGSAVVNAWEGLKGLAGQTDERQVAAQNIIADEAPIGNIAGNVAMLAPTMAIPGAATARGASLVGGATGAALTPGDLAERAKAAAFGAGGGAVGAGLSRLGARYGAQAPANEAQTELLRREGVALTPGQQAGGVVKALEDKATSVPFLGDVIQQARRRGVEDFNRAAIERATLPGMSVEGVGQGAIQDLRQGLGQAYDELLPKLNFKPDEQFVSDLQRLREMADLLPKKAGMHGKEINQFEQILDRQLIKRMTPQGNMSGETLKTAESEIGRLAAGYKADPSFDNRQLGDALSELQNVIRQNLTRTNPQYADELSAINNAYANFKRVQRAGAAIGSQEGVFTPAQLRNAVKAMDKSKDKRAFSEGTARLQDLADAGQTVLPSKVPDSGTPGRLMSNVFSLSGLLSSAGGAAAALPALLAYSRPGAAAINATMRGSGRLARGAGRAAGAAPGAAAVGGITLADLLAR